MLLTLLNLSDLCINHWKTLQSQNWKISSFSIQSGNTVPTVTVAVSGLNIHPIRNRIIPSPAPGWVTPPTCRQKMVEGGNGYLILRSCKQNHAFKLTAVCGIWPRKLDNEIVLHAIVGMRRDFSHYNAGPWDIKEN